MATPGETPPSPFGIQSSRGILQKRLESDHPDRRVQKGPSVDPHWGDPKSAWEGPAPASPPALLPSFVKRGAHPVARLVLCRCKPQEACWLRNSTCGQDASEVTQS